MNLTGLKSKKKALTALIKEFERIPSDFMSYSDKTELRRLRFQVNWLGKEINSKRAEKLLKKKKCGDSDAGL